MFPRGDGSEPSAGTWRASVERTLADHAVLARSLAMNPPPRFDNTRMLPTSPAMRSWPPPPRPMMPATSGSIAMTTTVPPPPSSSGGFFSRKAGPALLGFVFAAAVYAIGSFYMSRSATAAHATGREARSVASDVQPTDDGPPRGRAAAAAAPAESDAKRAHAGKRHKHHVSKKR